MTTKKKVEFEPDTPNEERAQEQTEPEESESKTMSVVISPKLMCLHEMNEILKEAGGLESNIGITSNYWDLQKEYRRLEAEEKDKAANTEVK